jgi:hypothetical protein
MIYERGLRKGMIWNVPCNDLLIIIIYFNSGSTVFWKFMNIDRKACNTFQKQLIINLLYQPVWAILVKLDEIIMIPLIILNKTQSFITG